MLVFTCVHLTPQLGCLTDICYGVDLRYELPPPQSSCVNAGVFRGEVTGLREL